MNIAINKFSNIGTYHICNNEENQDILCCGQDKNFCVISLADGVSSCKEAKRGAEVASQAITNLLLKKGAHFLEFENKKIVNFALSHILFELRQCADNESKELIDYSSTISSVLYDKKKKRMLCFNIGDSIILSIGQGECRAIFMPCDSALGCCVTTTKGAASLASVSIIEVEDTIDCVMIFSDGAWRQMYQKNKLLPEVKKLLINNEYEELVDFLNSRKSFDDYSFISMQI